MTFGIMITTRNRCEDLRRTLERVGSAASTTRRGLDLRRWMHR